MPRIGCAAMDKEGTQARVLVAEDGAALRKGIERMLAVAGYEVESVASGDAALDRLMDAGRPRVDLVLADVRLPGLSGPETIAAVRSQLSDPPPVLLMSGAPPSRDANTAPDDPVLLKPFGADQLLAAVEAALGSA